MSTSASTSKPADKTEKTSEEEKTQEDQHHLGVLEEDDEFEEFPVAGSWPSRLISILNEHQLTYFSGDIIDWDDSQTDLAHLGGGAPGAAKSGGDKLWEDNWDDDDIEDEFSMQLRSVGCQLSYCSHTLYAFRNELAKTSKLAGGEAMEH
jgi:26 proteasome complex subunit DSS1